MDNIANTSVPISQKKKKKKVTYCQTALDYYLVSKK